MTVRGRRAVKDCPTGPSAASRAAEPLTTIGDRASPCRQGEKLDIGAFVRCDAGSSRPWTSVLTDGLGDVLAGGGRVRLHHVAGAG
jgi:hypothetical protein